jgi:hypothetical protein
MFELLQGLFTLSGVAIALVVLIVAVVVWRYRKLDYRHRIVAKAVFLPVESIWPSAGRQGLPIRQIASASQILTLAGR